jgi:hypothetical protein
MSENEKPDKMPETPKPESGDIKPDGPAATATTMSKTPETEPGTDYSGIIGSVFIWVLILGAVTYWFFPHNRAQVFLQTSAQTPRQLSGIVLFKGAPVSKGTVYLVVEDPKKERYLASTILPVIEGGKFVTSGNESLVFGDSGKKPQPLRVTATFSGQQEGEKKEGEKKDKGPITVKGKATLYLNYPAPAGKWMTWGSGIIAALLAISLITLFTGELTRRRARQLFSITYIMSFMSLAVPIWAIAAVSKSEHAVDMMEQAPIGLIKGTARGVQNPQWLVNVGGAVEPAKEVPTKEEKGPLPAKEVPTKERETGRSSPVEAPTPTPTLPSPTPQQSPTPQENIGPDELRQVPGFALVRGGLAVPFYVIILAILGAGINMTKKVPDIQQKYGIKVFQKDEEPLWKGLLKMPVAVMRTAGRAEMDPATAKEQAEIVSDIRKDLIANYMGLISAPFLAIAVYYLLQVVATNIAEPVLVVVAFAVGFISDGIVAAITKVGSEMLKQASGGPSGRTADEQQTPEHGAVDLASPPSPKLPDATALPEVRYALVASSDPKELEKAEDLQRLLNMFPSVSLKVDGVPGPRTSAAYKTVTGKYLSGDPRGE